MTNTDDLYYQIALSLVPNIGAVQIRQLLSHFVTPLSIFEAKPSELMRMENIGIVRAQAIKNFNDFNLVEREIKYIQNNNINTTFITDTQYPQHLLQCADAPSLLYYKGNVNFNPSRSIAIVGTRSNSTYGKQVTEALVRYLQGYGVTIISGLAYGIDAVAHKAALNHNMPTLGIMAHGMDFLYPTSHKSLVEQMIANAGGIATEYHSGIFADKFNFPRRNRIVAGLTDATIVIETAKKGGSMITAELANGYNREVYAVPGKLTDAKSTGCNYLIAENKAAMYISPEEFVRQMGWDNHKPEKIIQQTLFVDLTDDERKVVDVLKQDGTVFIDHLTVQCHMTTSKLAGALLSLELQQIVKVLPGKFYELRS